MKIIHCADIHLDSKINANLDSNKAKERRTEILSTFEEMISYAAANNVQAILIAGDLFDTKTITKTTRNAVQSYILSNPQIKFYYLKGNHDNDNFLADLDEVPNNLLMFDDTWKYYKDGNVTIAGIELSTENAGNYCNSLVLEANRFNIVMLHGQEAFSASKDKTEIINIKDLKNKAIDYLALGHIHSYKKVELDARGTYCYPGCLEGRGFDECGEHGFVLLDIDENTGNYTQEFIPFAKRKLYRINVDISGCEKSTEITPLIHKAIIECNASEESLLYIILTGTVDVECEKNIEYQVDRFKRDYYFVKITDETKLKVNLEDYMLDESLKGEFIRLVMADEELDENEKAIIIRYGLQSLAGEEVE